VCYYCGCNKVVTKDKSRAEPYIDALFKEIEIQSSLFDKERLVEQMHFGGGTPTFFSGKQNNSTKQQAATVIQFFNRW
jgi:oxygen-independent coproporphyrinogen-3 oxidase